MGREISRNNIVVITCDKCCKARIWSRKGELWKDFWERVRKLGWFFAHDHKAAEQIYIQCPTCDEIARDEWFAKHRHD